MEEAGEARLDIHPSDLEVTTLLLESGSYVAGQSLRELDLRNRHGLTLLAVRRDGGFIAGRGTDTELRVGDLLFLLAQPGTRHRLPPDPPGAWDLLRRRERGEDAMNPYFIISSILGVTPRRRCPRCRRLQPVSKSSRTKKVRCRECGAEFAETSTRRPKDSES